MSFLFLFASLRAYALAYLVQSILVFVQTDVAMRAKEQHGMQQGIKVKSGEYEGVDDLRDNRSQMTKGNYTREEQKMIGWRYVFSKIEKLETSSTLHARDEYERGYEVMKNLHVSKLGSGGNLYESFNNLSFFLFPAYPSSVAQVFLSLPSKASSFYMSTSVYTAIFHPSIFFPFQSITSNSPLTPSNSPSHLFFYQLRTILFGIDIVTTNARNSKVGHDG